MVKVQSTRVPPFSPETSSPPCTQSTRSVGELPLDITQTEMGRGAEMTGRVGLHRVRNSSRVLSSSQQMPYASPCAPLAPPTHNISRQESSPRPPLIPENQEERLADDCLSTVAGPQPFALRRPWPKLAPVFIQRERILWANATGVYRIIFQRSGEPATQAPNLGRMGSLEFSKFGKASRKLQVLMAV